MQIKYNTISIVGNLRNTIKKERLALIGSRNISEATFEYGRFLGYEMVKQGYTVVSGLAMGADRTGMLGAIQAIKDGHSGSVIGLAPTTPYNVYPKKHQDLYDLVKQYGMLVYPYDLTTYEYLPYKKTMQNPYARFPEYPLLTDRSLLNGLIVSEVHALLDDYVVTGGSRYAVTMGLKDNLPTFVWHPTPNGFRRSPALIEKKVSNTKLLYPNMAEDLNYILEHLI